MYRLITCAVCLLAILPGVAVWNALPESVALHFNFYNEPDNFASKEFAVFGLPALMVVLQMVSWPSSIISNITTKEDLSSFWATVRERWIFAMSCTVIERSPKKKGLWQPIFPE